MESIHTFINSLLNPRCHDLNRYQKRTIFNLFFLVFTDSGYWIIVWLFLQKLETFARTSTLSEKELATFFAKLLLRWH